MDEYKIAQSLLSAALTASVVLLLCGLPGPRRIRALVSAGGVGGVGLGLYLACWQLQLLPKWPPVDDLHRYLAILFPAVVVVELLACFAGRWQLAFWVPRLLIAAAAGRVLLHGSIFIQAPDEYTPAEWTTTEAWWVLGGLAAALAGMWALLYALVRLAPGRSVSYAVAGALTGSSVAVALSGYATGGEPNLALAAALAGAVTASFALRKLPDQAGMAGLGVVGLFAVLVAGRFFGSLTTLHGVVLFFSLLLAWLPELPYVRRFLKPWQRGVLRVALVAIPVVLVLIPIVLKSVAELTPSSSEPGDTTSDDYKSLK
jgi:hypothetical protein